MRARKGPRGKETQEQYEHRLEKQRVYAREQRAKETAQQHSDRLMANRMRLEEKTAVSMSDHEPYMNSKEIRQLDLEPELPCPSSSELKSIYSATVQDFSWPTLLEQPCAACEMTFEQQSLVKQPLDHRTIAVSMEWIFDIAYRKRTHISLMR